MLRQCKQCLLSGPFYRLALYDCVGGVARQVQCCRAGYVIYFEAGNDGWSVRPLLSSAVLCLVLLLV
jgi:hypothetical protein